MTHPAPTPSTDAGELLARIDARLAALEHAAARIEAAAAEAPHAIAAIGDTFDSVVDRLAARGIHVDARARELLALLDRLTAPETTRALGVLVDQLEALALLANRAQLDGPSGRVVGAALDALATSAAAPPRQVGLFGALGALGNPEIQRALGLLLDTAQALGTSLAAQPNGNLLTHEARR